jgi:diguanylate cyclase (GGDEF)-like protein
MLAFHSIQDQGSQTLGYLVGRIDLHELEHRLAPPPSDANVLFWLLDKEGRFVARAGKILPTPGRERFGFPLNGPGNSDASRTVGPASLPGLAGPAFYISRTIEGPLQCTLVATLPVSVAYRTLDDSRGRLLAYSLSFLLLVFFLTYFVTRQLLLPIRRLSAGALRMGAGDLDVQLPESGHDEITDLTRVFNEMARRVREGLQRVEEARDALAHSNEELTGANKILGRLAITDGLTGLYNHRHFHDSLRRELLLAERETAPMALLMIDLDSFKAYNDRWGHTAGDAALRCVARALREGLRESDLAFRYGGEELAALLPGCDKERGSVVAEKLRSAIRVLPCPGHQPGAIVTVSIGVAAYPEDSTEPHQLLELADAALYAAKRGGRDRVVAAPDAEPARMPSSRS